MCDGISSKSVIDAMVCMKRTVSMPLMVCIRCERVCPSYGHLDHIISVLFQCHKPIAITIIDKCLCGRWTDVHCCPLNNTIWNARPQLICVYVCCPTIFVRHSSLMFHLWFVELAISLQPSIWWSNISTILHNRKQFIQRNATQQIFSVLSHS